MQEELAGVELVGLVGGAIDAMGPPRLADVLRMRLGIGGAAPMTLAEIGQRIDVSRERVRQLEDKGLSRLTRQLKTSPGGAELRTRLKVAIRPREAGWQARLSEAVDVLCPGWPAPLCEKIVIRLIGAKDSPGRRQTRPPQLTTTSQQEGSLYEAVAARFEGVRVTGRWKRFEKAGWFFDGETSARCPGCGLALEGFRAPYETSKGMRYHYWALVCLGCRAAFAPADLPEDVRHGLYRDSNRRPRPHNDDPN